MYLLGISILLICLIPDLTVHFTLGNVIFKSQLCGLFLYFILFRKSFKYIAIILFIYAFLVGPFTGLGFTQIFFSYFVVLWIFYKLRTDIYLESYFIQPLWVMLMAWMQWILVHLLEFNTLQFEALPHIVLSGFLNSLFLSLFVMPLFLFWDYLYKFFGANSYDDKVYSGLPVLRGKRRSKSLL